MAAARAGHSPSLFLEEVDKIKLDSEFQAKMFSHIINAVHSVGGQIVASSNLSEMALRHRLGEQYGGGIVRRIIGPRGNQGVIPEEVDGQMVWPEPDPSKGGFYVNFGDNTIQQNRELGHTVVATPSSAPKSSRNNYNSKATTQESQASQKTSPPPLDSSDALFPNDVKQELLKGSSRRGTQPYHPQPGRRNRP